MQPEKQPITTALPEPVEETPLKIPDRSFTSEALYALLVAEMAIDRRRYDIALGNYVQQATATLDPEVTARATQIARILKSHSSALEMAQLWEDLEPKNVDAQLVITAELIDANRLEEATLQATKLLESSDSKSAFDTIAIKATENDIAVANSLLDIYQPLTEKYPEASPLHFGYSVLLQHSGKLTEAKTAIEHTLKLDPTNVRYAFQETRILQQMGQLDLALKKLDSLVKNNPDNIGLRAKYARILSNHDLSESRKQFNVLHQQAPNDPEILYSLGLVEKEAGHLEKALMHFQELLSSGYYTSAAHFHLGVIHEKLSDPQSALTHYNQVAPGQNYLSAVVRSSELLVNKGQIDEALTLVEHQRSQAPSDFQESLYILESDILSTAGRISAAELSLSKGLEFFPTSTKLLYSRAMLYSRIGSVAAAEKDLRAILEITPNNAAALNALGYTLADRTERIDEAYVFVKKALALTPDDPAVMDSLGWVEYRRGNTTEAINILTKAMEAMPDHEIAAHLGEVLWVAGKEKKAMAVWKEGLRLNPKSPIIHQTIHRLNASLK